MSCGAIVALVLSLSAQLGIDSNLVLAIIEQENPRYNALAVHHNSNGSMDLGIMQLNDRSIPDFIRWYWNKEHEFDWKNPHDNIWLGLMHLRALLSTPGMNVWQAVICYNAGTLWFRNGHNPPNSSINYANAVFAAWSRRTNDRG
jgi:soluble lytic murein transglycosylase-like protein